MEHYRRFKNIRAVILDMDGTILDTAEDLCAAACHAAHIVGLPSFSLEEYKKVISYGIREMYQRLLPAHTPEQMIEQVIAEHLRYYPEHCTERSCYYPDMEKMLKMLAVKKIKLAVITNKTESTAIKLTDYYCSDIPFQAVWGNNHVRPLKPDVQMGVLACEELHVKPEQVLYLGDGNTDMYFAKNVGFGAVGVTWGYNSRENLLKHGADVLLEHPLELLEMIE